MTTAVSERTHAALLRSIAGRTINDRSNSGEVMVRRLLDETRARVRKLRFIAAQQGGILAEDVADELADIWDYESDGVDPDEDKDSDDA